MSSSIGRMDSRNERLPRSFNDHARRELNANDSRATEIMQARVVNGNRDHSSRDVPERDLLAKKVDDVQRIALNEHIEKDLKLRKFCTTIYLGLSAMFACCFAKTHEEASKLEAALKALKELPYTERFDNLVGRIIDIRKDQEGFESIKEIIDLCGVGTKTAEEIFKHTAMTLCEIYEWQIKSLLQEEDIEKLGIYTCLTIIGHLLDAEPPHG